MGELDCEETWAPKNWCFGTVVLEKTLESPLDCKEIHLVHSEGDQSWVFFGRTDAEAETPILWPPHEKSWLFGKYPMPQGIGGRRRRGRQKMRLLDGITDSIDMSLSKLWSWWWTGRPGVLWLIGSQRVRHNWVTELNWYENYLCSKKNTLITWLKNVWLYIYIHISYISIGSFSYWISTLPISEAMSISIPTTWSSSLKLDIWVT